MINPISTHGTISSYQTYTSPRTGSPVEKSTSGNLGSRKVCLLTPLKVERDEEFGESDWTDIVAPLLGLVMTVWALVHISK